MIEDIKRNIKIFTDEVDGASAHLIYEFSKAHPSSQVRVMPDVHLGKGSVIGFTATLDENDFVAPEIIGVDIGCGVRCIEIPKVDLEQLDKVIHEQVPVGTRTREKRPAEADILGKLKCFSDLRELDHLEKSLGSLGAGNHFIEVDIDEEGQHYLVIHTGSRNLGVQVCGHYSKKLKAQPCRAVFNDYLHDLYIAQTYAVLNRMLIAKHILDNMSIPQAANNYFESVHNYIDDECIIRKGAISAHKGQRVIIPLNMKDGSVIAIGKGNPDWNFSAPHGAGRIMSRTEAKKKLSMDEFERSMQGIYSTTISTHTLDEAPMAYKDKDKVLGVIDDTVTIEKFIKPIYNFKG